MPAKRTVDETGETTAGAFVGLRLSMSQALKLDDLAKAYGLTRSATIRKLIADTWMNTPYPTEATGDPF